MIKYIDQTIIPMNFNGPVLGVSQQNTISAATSTLVTWFQNSDP